MDYKSAAFLSLRLVVRARALGNVVVIDHCDYEKCPSVIYSVMIDRY